MTLLAEMQGKVTIRVAVSDDAAALAEFAERTFRGTFERDNTPEDMNRYVAHAFGVEAQRAELGDARGLVLLMESAARIVGYAQLLDAPSPREVVSLPAIELQRFYVGHEYHGLGLAQLLMTRTLGAAFERGAITLWLGVWEHNARAIAFYGKLGFVDVASHIFMLGNDQQTDRIMCRAVRN